MNEKSEKPEMTKTEKSKKEKQEAFLTQFRICATVSHSAKLALISRRTHYLWLEKDPAYAEAFEAAKVVANEALFKEAWRRATGFDEPVIYQGKQSLDAEGNPLVIRKYSDTLLIFLMKGAMPGTYRERFEVTGGGGAPLIPYVDKRLSKLTDEELKELDGLTRKLTSKVDG